MEGTTSADMALREAAYSRLVRFNPSLEVVPDLATEWESNDDNSAWTFTLNEDATFATVDQSVLAEDIEATINMMLEEPDSARASDLGPFDSIEVEDDHRFTINLTQGSLLYPKTLAETDNRFTVLPSNVVEDRRDELTSTDFGTGPLVISNLEPGSRLEFEGYDGYHLTDADGNELPYVDELTWNLVVDPTAQTNALTDQRVDALQMAPNSQMNSLAQTDGVESQRLDSTSFISIVLNTTVENENGEQPFDDVRVRKAMKHALDLEAMAAVTDDRISPMHHGSVTPAHEFSPDFDPGLEFGLAAQPDEARSLLEEAGYGDGLSLPTMYYSPDTSPARGPTSVLFQEQMSNVGIEFEIQQLTNDVWLSEYWNQEGVWYASGYAGRLVDTTVIDLALHSEGPWNSGRWSSDELDAAYQRIQEATTTEELAEAITEHQRIYHLDGAWITTGAEQIMAAYNDYVRGVQPLPSSSIDYHSRDWLTSEAPEGPS